MYTITCLNGKKLYWKKGEERTEIGTKIDVEWNHLSKSKALALKPFKRLKQIQAAKPAVPNSDKTSAALRMEMCLVIACFIGIFYQLF